MDAASNIRAARRRAGLTQAALAERARTSQATVSAYEHGHKQPGVETLARLLAAAGSRLIVRPDAPPVIQPSPEQHPRVARGLMSVLELAEALPTRHERELRYPRLDAARDGAA